MAFDGPGPETINGRLAMLGMVYAFFNEQFTGLTVGSQVCTSIDCFVHFKCLHLVGKLVS
jgi:hypothetical protein